MLTAQSCQHPSFQLHMGTAVRDLIRAGDRVVGVQADGSDGPREFAADLVIGTKALLLDSELVQATFQFTTGAPDEKGYILAVNCFCFYTDDKGPVSNPPGALWRLMPANEVTAGMETARVKMPN